MRLLSVNVGKAQPIATKSGSTGIFKVPQPGTVHIGPLGLKGDAIVDTKHHGGPDQAVYLFGQPDYDWFAQSENRPMHPGLFGENLTVSELESATVRVGDRFDIEGVLLEITYPRIPCVTLAARLGDPTFVKRFHAAKRPGVYARVLKPGFVEAGMTLMWEKAASDAPLAIDLM
ncbi:MOSC domain-containing protein [Pelagibacterium limicola]|uniref:MOSC domain-containing protein n=1 Tax=Pelagibacterium limicola TaxID=2791022 RepID=UPI0018AFCE44|nr:MOSC domain-containing protein [Pelagibacterium limicola]